MHRATVERREGSYDWLHFAERSGEEGEAWAQAYRRYEPLEGSSIEALALLRGNEIDAGRLALERLRGELLAAADAPPSVRHVLDRWYFGVVGYLHYRLEEFAAAEAAMVAAHDAVSAAVGRRRFLLLLANHCHEFSLHRARIARNQRRWREMAAHLEHARGMMADRVPLCHLADGTPIFFATLGDYYRALPLTAAEDDWLSDLLDAGRRLQLFDRFVHRLQAQPGFAIPYP